MATGVARGISSIIAALVVAIGWPQRGHATRLPTCASATLALVLHPEQVTMTGTKSLGNVW